MNQYTISKGTKTALITSNSFTEDGETISQVTAIIYVGFGTSGETALRSNTLKTVKNAEKWANNNM